MYIDFRLTPDPYLVEVPVFLRRKNRDKKKKKCDIEVKPAVNLVPELTKKTYKLICNFRFDYSIDTAQDWKSNTPFPRGEASFFDSWG